MMLGKYFKGDFDTECDWINGAFLIFNRSILDQLPGGKLDERFFMYGEDHLWSYQIKKLGYRNYFYSGTSIVHINNASTSKDKRFTLLKVINLFATVVPRQVVSRVNAVSRGVGLVFHVILDC